MFSCPARAPWLVSSMRGLWQPKRKLPVGRSIRSTRSRRGIPMTTDSLHTSVVPEGMVLEGRGLPGVMGGCQAGKTVHSKAGEPTRGHCDTGHYKLPTTLYSHDCRSPASNRCPPALLLGDKCYIQTELCRGKRPTSLLGTVRADCYEMSKMTLRLCFCETTLTSALSCGITGYYPSPGRTGDTRDHRADNWALKNDRFSETRSHSVALCSLNSLCRSG